MFLVGAYTARLAIPPVTFSSTGEAILNPKNMMKIEKSPLLGGSGSISKFCEELVSNPNGGAVLLPVRNRGFLGV